MNKLKHTHGRLMTFKLCVKHVLFCSILVLVQRSSDTSKSHLMNCFSWASIEPPCSYAILYKADMAWVAALMMGFDSSQ